MEFITPENIMIVSSLFLAWSVRKMVGLRREESLSKIARRARERLGTIGETVPLLECPEPVYQHATMHGIHLASLARLRELEVKTEEQARTIKYLEEDWMLNH